VLRARPCKLEERETTIYLIAQLPLSSAGRWCRLLVHGTFSRRPTRSSLQTKPVLSRFVGIEMLRSQLPHFVFVPPKSVIYSLSLPLTSRSPVTYKVLRRSVNKIEDTLVVTTARAHTPPTDLASMERRPSVGKFLQGRWDRRETDPRRCPHSDTVEDRSRA